MVDALTNQDIQFCDPSCTATERALDVRAETTGAVQSVKFDLTGPFQLTRTENLPIWSLFGNEGELYTGHVLPPGSYSLSAQPFSQTQASGTPGPIKTVNFVIQANSSVPTPILTEKPTPALPPTPDVLDGVCDETFSAFMVCAVDPKNSCDSCNIQSVSLLSYVRCDEFSTWYSSNKECCVNDACGTQLKAFEQCKNCGLVSPDSAPPTPAPPTNPLPTPPTQPMEVTRLVLIDAETNQDIAGGLYCDPFACTGSATLMDIRAETTGPVQSVRLTIDGPVQDTKIENTPVWSLFGNDGGAYNGHVLPPGSYTVTAQPFSGTQASGIAGPVKTVDFMIRQATAPPSPVRPTLAPPTIAPPTQAASTGLVAVTNLILVDAETNTDIVNGFRCGAYLCANDSLLIDIRAEVTNAVESVKFTITGPIEESRIENTAPFVLFGNTAGNYNGMALPPGNYTVTVQPFSLDEAQGKSDGISKVIFTVPDLSITQFVLVDSSSDQDIPGGLYCQPVACTGGAKSFNIRAETAGDVKSVKLILKKEGQIISNRIENDKPWSHFGDLLGDYKDHVLAPGQYTIEATAYPLPDGQGMGSFQSLDFAIPSVRRQLAASS